MDRSGCEYIKCKYAGRDMNKNPVCSYEGDHCIYKSVEYDAIAKKDAEIAALQEKVKYLQNDNADRYTRIKELEEELSDLKFYLNNLPAHHQMQKINQLRKGLDAVEELIDNSKGVAGLHLNGELAPWGELRTGGKFELWLLDFDSALNDTAVDECRAALREAGDESNQP